ncbi:MAG: hypothetical protein ACI8S6_002225 [Myxococcota bacterium]|jgi:hypothetical protein
MHMPQTLRELLNTIGSAPCLAAAEVLETGRLHLRGAGLTAGDAVRLAAALREEGRAITSLSLSHNPLGDAGTVALAGALPAGLRELGLVGCGIGDVGGEALLVWAQQARGLQMLCVEGNRFSPALRHRLRALGCMVV